MALLTARYFRLALVLSIVSACDGPPTEPATRLDPSTASRTNASCETQIIYDPESGCPDPGGVTTDNYFGDELAPESVLLSVSSFYEDPGAAPCPRDMTGTTLATVRSGKTGRVYDFTSTGKWTIDWLRSSIYLPSSMAVYNWPAGFWPAFDQNDGHYALIKIGRARGVCHGGGNVTFISFYDVVMEGDEPKSPGSSSGGGDGGGDGGSGTTCHTEYVFIEVNDGDGWYVWWQGYANVCE